MGSLGTNSINVGITTDSNGSFSIGSGQLDVQTIVNNLMAVEEQPVVQLQNETTTLQSQVTAFQTLNTNVSTLLDKANSILFNGGSVPYQTPYDFEDRLQESMFAMQQAASSDETVLTATATTGTATGNYAITVSNLAQAKTMASGNFADTDTTTTGTGTLVFQIGSSTPVPVTIDSTNNTLSGVCKAINSANAGVTASIMNDGTSNPYRLLITSNNTGTANAFAVTNNLTGGQALGLIKTADAGDAQLNVNGINITKSSNTISDVINGVTLNLKGKTLSQAVNVTVNADTDGIVSALNDLVTAYNTVNSFINSQFAYDTTNQTAGVLSGDPTLRDIQTNLQSIITQSVTNGYTSSYNTLSQIGLSFNDDGSLTLDQTQLQAALSSNPTAVAALLLGDGTPDTPEQATATDPRVTYQSLTSATQPGTYNIAVTDSGQSGFRDGKRQPGSTGQ